MKSLKLPEEKIGLSILLLLIVLAYATAVAFRFIWVADFSSAAAFHWNGQLMINTNDGYWFAEGARDILTGGHQPNDLSPVASPLAQLTALLARIVPVSFETLILYMPAFLGSLIVVPLILIGRAVGQTTLGFAAALIGGIAHSYYNRTMTGYYDTDMLNIVFPVFEVYSLIFAMTHRRNRFLLPVTLSIALYQWWYPQAYTLDTALFATVVAYALIFERKEIYLYKIALFILIGILALPIMAKLAIAGALFALFHTQKGRGNTLFWPLFAAVALLYFATGGIDPIWAQLKAYVIRDATSNETGGLHFYNVAQTVREAGHIPFSLFAERISGNVVVFLAALTGYLLMLLAYRPMLLTLPLAGLGFIAIVGGLRFTVYAVPAMALGLGYLFVLIGAKAGATPVRYALVSIMTAGALYPNYLHIKEYQVPTVFTADEVATLVDFGKKVSREDYVVSWWDFGYPIRYYSDTKTWVDGGKHSGDVNFPASFVLTESNTTAVVNMLRTFTEETEKGFAETNKTGTDFAYMMRQEGFTDPQSFLDALARPDFKNPAKTRDVYLMLPYRMMEIFPTVRLFSNLDLTTGEPKNRSFFYFTQGADDTPAALDLGGGITVDKQNGRVEIAGQKIPLKAFISTEYGPDKKLIVHTEPVQPNGELSLVFMKNYGAFILADDDMLSSTFVQMFVFEHYDPALFEPISLTPMVKIYRLKK